MNHFLICKNLCCFSRQMNRVATLMRIFPNLDMEAVKEQYPLVDIEKVKKLRKTDGHFVRD